MRSIGLAAVSLQGFVDAIERGVVYGWAWNPQRPDEQISVEILHGSRSLAVVQADRFRDDLVDLEIGDGHHAFEFQLPEELTEGIDSAEIEVRFAGSTVPLPRMQVRPERRVRDGQPQRPEAELIAALRERITMQEQVINDMSNVMNGLVERLRNVPALPVPAGRDGDAEAVRDELHRQTALLESLEVYMTTFGQSLREIAERSAEAEAARPRRGGRFRSMDAVFLLLIAAVVVGFAVAFGSL